jgi:hypothetical protein
MEAISRQEALGAVVAIVLAVVIAMASALVIWRDNEIPDNWFSTRSQY